MCTCASTISMMCPPQQPRLPRRDLQHPGVGAGLPLASAVTGHAPCPSSVTPKYTILRHDPRPPSRQEWVGSATAPVHGRHPLLRIHDYDNTMIHAAKGPAMTL